MATLSPEKKSEYYVTVWNAKEMRSTILDTIDVSEQSRHFNGTGVYLKVCQTTIFVDDVYVSRILGDSRKPEVSQRGPKIFVYTI